MAERPEEKMVFYSKFPLGVILFAFLVVSISVEALPGLGNCAVMTIETTGLTRTVCNMGSPTTYATFKSSGSWKPPHLIRDVTPLDSHGSSSTLKIGSDATLTARLCPNGGTPISTTDPNPEGRATLVVKCLPKGSIVGQQAPTFLSTNTRLARWQDLRDPYVYVQKSNRPFIKR